MMTKSIGKDRSSAFTLFALFVFSLLMPCAAQAAKVEVQPQNAVGWRGSSTSVVVALVVGRKDGTVWGSGPYTDDSNISTAAVHSGALAEGENGLVKIAILPGQSSYAASTSNGVTTSAYGSWSGSYSITKWNYDGTTLDDPVNFAYWNGVSGTFNVSLTGVSSGSIWGTDTYTSDSLLAKAAVHAGKLTVGQSAVVPVTLLPGLSSYAGSTRNGVSSSSWGSYGASYTFGTAPSSVPSISSSASVSATVGQTFSYQIQASNDPFFYSATGLPSGLALDATTGLISGAPGSAGTYSVRLYATNSLGSASLTLTITVAQAGANGTAGADCFFNWAEKNYADHFAPATGSQTYDVYYYRYYSATKAYLVFSNLAVSSAAQRVYYIGPLTGGALADLGDAAALLKAVGCQ